MEAAGAGAVRRVVRGAHQRSDGGAPESRPTPTVRAALCETIGRLPYRDAQQVARAESVAHRVGGPRQHLDRSPRRGEGPLGLIRFRQALRPPSGDALAILRTPGGSPRGRRRRAPPACGACPSTR